MIIKEKIKPIRIIAEKGISDLEMCIIMSGIKNTLEIMNMPFSVKEKMKFILDKPNFIEEKLLQVYSSKSNKLDYKKVLEVLCEKFQYIENKNPYFVLVTSKDLLNTLNNKLVLGASVKEKGFIISVGSSFKKIKDDVLRLNILKYTSTHECGHLFGLVEKGRKNSELSDLINHCSNDCIMSKELIWSNMTNDLKEDLYCQDCKKDLASYTQKNFLS